MNKKHLAFVAGILLMGSGCAPVAAPTSEPTPVAVVKEQSKGFVPPSKSVLATCPEPPFPPKGEKWMDDLSVADWSVDGRLISYTVEIGANRFGAKKTELWIICYDGSKKQKISELPVTYGERLVSLGWRGDEIVFARQGMTTSGGDFWYQNLVIVDVSTSEVTSVKTDKFSRGAYLSADGKWLDTVLWANIVHDQPNPPTPILIEVSTGKTVFKSTTDSL